MTLFRSKFRFFVGLWILLAGIQVALALGLVDPSLSATSRSTTKYLILSVAVLQAILILPQYRIFKRAIERRRRDREPPARFSQEMTQMSASLSDLLSDKATEEQRDSIRKALEEMKASAQHAGAPSPDEDATRPSSQA